MNKEILSVVELVSKLKSLPREKIFEVLEDALMIATKKKYTQEIDIRVSINRKNGHFDTFRRWMIVNTVKNPTKEITLEAARFHNSNVQLSEFIEDKIDSINFDRISTQAAKKIIIKKVREIEQSMISNKFHNCKGKIIQGIVKKIYRDYVILNLNNDIEAIILRKDMLPNEYFTIGDRVRGILYEIKSKFNRIQLFISRTRAEMLIELFHNEVPEMRENLVSIQAIVRDPGFRSKVVVKTHNKKIDPVGSFVGIKGARVQSVSKELNGERIDIILWSDNPAQFVINAMAPVRVVSIIVHSNIHAMDVIVKLKYLAQAIGKNGQNVKLVSKLSGWELNIMTENNLKYNNKMKIYRIRSLFNKYLTIKSSIINILIKSGFSSLLELACIPYLMLIEIKGIDSKIAHLIQEQSDNYITKLLLKQNHNFFYNII
ncbi:transcription termination/antitermination protein NusA [Buchnera aphidicola (Therioaphis trifolii)]|uniref:Transcription termination/antitermination protein NusA n=1 Tax=Buchnera aphidicola (Therioaphis trifolii) TaxID=1241884 RepID=A0A4D6YBW4_9GAMM|nr:transcription termination/antitermination protein NusA [Buchnera aphidicola (Therioaphis trifolii)]